MSDYSVWLRNEKLVMKTYIFKCFFHSTFKCGFSGIDTQNRTAWRSGIRSTSRLLPTPATGTPAADEK